MTFLLWEPLRDSLVSFDFKWNDLTVLIFYAGGFSIILGVDPWNIFIFVDFLASVLGTKAINSMSSYKLVGLVMPMAELVPDLALLPNLVPPRVN